MGYKIIVNYDTVTPINKSARIYKVIGAYLAGDSIPTEIGFSNGLAQVDVSADNEAVKLFNDVTKATITLTNPDGSAGTLNVSSCNADDHARGSMTNNERYRMAVDRANSLINATCI